MSLLLVRHGETALNAARTMQPADTPLSARGVLQARAVAARLMLLAPAAIISSDLPRALQTARAIAAATGLAVQTSPLLHERNFGALRGRPYDELGFDPLTMAEAPPGGESIAAFLRRVDLAFDFIVERRRTLGGPLVVVSHGLVIRAWLGVQVDVAPGTVLPERIANTSVTVAGAEPPHHADIIDSVGHLAGAASEDGSSLSGG